MSHVLHILSASVVLLGVALPALSDWLGSRDVTIPTRKEDDDRG